MIRKIPTFEPLCNYNKAINKLLKSGIRPTKQRMILAKLLFEKGDQVKDLTLKIPTDVLNGLNLASISPVRGEVQIENNTFSFRSFCCSFGNI